MKRRGTSRRQVLDLDTNSSSPKRSWQTKYQQICMDHKNSDTKALPAQNHSENLERKLPQLVGYTSDSEGEEGKKPQEGDLDSKVEDFLKEISDIVPAENPSDQENLPVLTIVEKEENPKASTKTLLKNAKSKSKPLFGPLPMLAVQSVPDSIQEENSAQPTIAWQECYDESSGCYYYWNTETNEVTWEMPQDLRAYQVALEQWNAQQLLLAQRASGGLVPMYMNQSQSVPTSQQVQKKQSKSQEKTKNKRTKSNSDSEDDKIELITSYGPTSEDEDSDNAPDSAPVSATVSASVPVHSMKKKKLEIPKSKAKKEYKEEMAIGPQLPPDYVIPIDMKDKVSASPKMQGNFQTSESSHVICEQPKKKLKAADVNNSEKELQPILTSPQLMKEKDSDEMLIINTQPDSEQISTLQRLKALKNKGSEVSSSESDQSDNEVKTNEEIEEHDENVEEDDDIEDSILERLKNQAKILQELGGEIPEEIKELLKPSPEPIEETSSSPANKQEHQETDSSAIEAVVVNDVAENSEVNEANKLPKTEEIEVSAIPEFIENIEGQTMIEETEQIYENHSESNGLKLIENETKLEDIIPQEKAPTSFSLIAGYGNEDDSEIEEDNKADENVNKSDKPAPLFPIVNNEKEKPSITKSANLKVIKLSAKAKELIHSSTTTGRARATDFVSTSDGLRPAESVPKEPVALSSSNNYTEDFVEPIKKVSRKKRLEVPVIKHEKPYKISETLSKENTIHESKEVASKVAVEKSEVAVEYRPIPYTSTWAYNSELKGGEHRGFGFEYNLDQKLPAGKKGMIQFIKADTLMPKNEPVASLQDKKQIIEEIKQEDKTTKEQATDLAQVVSEKVKFLSEGKEAVPPVQVMAIQLETLTTALGAGGLSVKYLWEWLTSLAGQLASLEQAAAPLGWLCHWDRSYKRYYYRNEETGAIQWEYPNETPTHGGEEAMELCDSPPPPSTPTALQPLPMAPPPPRISSRSPSPDLVTMTDETPPPPLPPLPPPPPIISEQPPLPPLPPSDSPPPLPPSPPPPPPPPIISTSLLSGEPLPPGVDLPEEMFDSSQPPLPVAPPPPAKSPPPPPPPPDITESAEPIYNMGYDVTAVPMHYDPYQVAPDYAGSMYQADATYSSGENYVIARPPANNPAPGTESMAIELDSFYSEVAALDPPPPPPAPSPSPPPPPSPPTQVQPAEPMKKKKKTKLTPGLALKKKGVPSLVAKWQQVQQDVRRESASEET